MSSSTRPRTCRPPALRPPHARRRRPVRAVSAETPAAAPQQTGFNPDGGDVRHDKTFVVFSGDLDKTIAVFIMANGAAAMGRKVTIFFTFWGLNILRKPKRVRVRKTLIERMFGMMMPRGTRKLGLSRMNMGGIGAKMIRWIMKSKNVESLESLMKQATDHGVRLVACPDVDGHHGHPSGGAHRRGGARRRLNVPRLRRDQRHEPVRLTGRGEAG